MSRVIKFRFFDKGDSRMKYSDVEYFDDMVAYRFGHRHFEEDDNSDIIQMQFTGLHDKNGKEVYESDMLKHRLGNLVVYWHDKLLKFVVDIPIIGGDTAPCDLFQFYDLECIGNIYEHKHLLP